MKARIPEKTTLQEEIEKAVNQARVDAIKMLVVTHTASQIDVGLANSTIEKTQAKNKSYIDSILSGNVTWREIAEQIEEERGITFNWIDESYKE